jgi:uncharacterized heparinase superfamily protein
VAPCARAPTLEGAETFRFLNEVHRAVGPAAWNDPAREKLWLYNLHYFDDLTAADASARADRHRALLLRWVAENPPGRGNGWEPYPTSLRIVNWIKWALATPVLPRECVQSLAVQTRWLHRRLEHHLLGNHLFANAKALMFAGAFFVGPEAATWSSLGQRLLRRELREQVLPDGGHFERSPMYHAILLEDVLDLINLAGVYPGAIDPETAACVRESAAPMARWLRAMSHPDGGIGFFNDAALRIVPSVAELVAYGGRLGLRLLDDGAESIESAAVHPVTGREAPSGPAGSDARDPGVIWLRDSGYVRLEAGPAVALLDLAPIGPDYLPGHAHADTLSFELSLFGRRVIVNRGTSRYGDGPQRLAERGTAAHSTVQIDGADSSEVWGGFRVARRARPFDVAVRSTRDPAGGVGTAGGAVGRLPEGAPGALRLCASGAHDGYRRLPGRPIHRRTWELSANRLVVADRIEGGYGEAIARFHLHPDVSADADGSGAFGRSSLPDGTTLDWSVEGGTAIVVADVWCPEFGLQRPASCLEVRLTQPACCLVLTWDPPPDVPG